MITLGEGWAINPSTDRSEGNVDQQSGTFMHELGHSLGLTHGGNDHGHYKPNYLSVMNYAFQVSSLIGNRSLDYSRCSMMELNENNLSETKGMSNSCPQDMNTITYARGHSHDTANCKGAPEMMPTGKPIDWNRDNDYHRPSC